MCLSTGQVMSKVYVSHDALQTYERGWIGFDQDGNNFTNKALIIHEVVMCDSINETVFHSDDSILQLL